MRPNDLGCEQERPNHTLVQQVHGDLALVSSASLSILPRKGLVLDLAQPYKTHTEAQIPPERSYVSRSGIIIVGEFAHDKYCALGRPHLQMNQFLLKQITMQITKILWCKSMVNLLQL